MTPWVQYGAHGAVCNVTIVNALMDQFLFVSHQPSMFENSDNTYLTPYCYGIVHSICIICKKTIKIVHINIARSCQSHGWWSLVGHCQNEIFLYWSKIFSCVVRVPGVSLLIFFCRV